jgi:hypothetical protein
MRRKVCGMTVRSSKKYHKLHNGFMSGCPRVQMGARVQPKECAMSLHMHDFDISAEGFFEPLLSA